MVVGKIFLVKAPTTGVGAVGSVVTGIVWGPGVAAKVPDICFVAKE